MSNLSITNNSNYQIDICSYAGEIHNLPGRHLVCTDVQRWWDSDDGGSPKIVPPSFGTHFAPLALPHDELQQTQAARSGKEASRGRGRQRPPAPRTSTVVRCPPCAYTDRITYYTISIPTTGPH